MNEHNLQKIVDALNLKYPSAVVAEAVKEAEPIMRSSGVTPENLVLDGAGHASRHEIAWAVFDPVLRRSAEAAE